MESEESACEAVQCGHRRYVNICLYVLMWYECGTTEDSDV